MDFESPWFLVVMITCGSYFGAWIIRRMVELRWPHLKPTKMSAQLAVEDTALAGSKVTGQVSLYSTPFAEWWNSFILYLLAPALGIALCFLARSGETYPPQLQPAWLTLVFGLSLGFFSSLGYKAFRKLFADKTGIQVDDQGHSIGPPPGS